MKTTHTPIILSECISALPANSLAVICDRSDSVRALSGNVRELPVGAQAIIHELNAHKHPASSCHTPRRSFADASKLLRLSQQCIDNGIRLWHLITDSDDAGDIGRDTIVLACREEYGRIVCAYAEDENGGYSIFFLDGTMESQSLAHRQARPAGDICSARSLGNLQGETTRKGPAR